MPQSQMQNILSTNNQQKISLRAKGKRKRAIKNFIEAMLYLSPALILFMAFVFIPLFRSFQISAHITDPIGRLAKFVGLLNYQRLFETPNFANSLKKTFLFILYTVPTSILVSLGLAVQGDLSWKGISFFRLVLSVTIAISGATTSLMI